MAVFSLIIYICNNIILHIILIFIIGDLSCQKSHQKNYMNLKKL